MWLVSALFGPSLRKWLSIDTIADNDVPLQERQRQLRRQERARWGGVGYSLAFTLLGLAQLGVLPQFVLVAHIGLVIVSLVYLWLLFTA